jgi:hypothetical protein
MNKILYVNPEKATDIMDNVTHKFAKQYRAVDLNVAGFVKYVPYDKLKGIEASLKTALESKNKKEAIQSVLNELRNL